MNRYSRAAPRAAGMTRVDIDDAAKLTLDDGKIANRPGGAGELETKGGVVRPGLQRFAEMGSGGFMAAGVVFRVPLRFQEPRQLLVVRAARGQRVGGRDEARRPPGHLCVDQPPAGERRTGGSVEARTVGQLGFH